MEILKYKDEADKSLGIAGMAISLFLSDNEHYLAQVSLEEGENAISMGEEFFFIGNPRISAKIAWKEFFKQFQIMSGLMIGNVVCRCYASGKPVSREMVGATKSALLQQAREYCSLEEDESDTVFRRSYDYYNQAFAHPTVCTVARDLASKLRLQRRLTSGEVIDILRQLSAL